MKKIISLTFAVVSTTFLFVGATHAAEKFDGLARTTGSDVLHEGPSSACVIVPDPEPDPASQNQPE